jgi:hypothetical protein
MAELTSDEAKKLSDLGASKGGRARANVLTASERSEIAKKAIAARWAKHKAGIFPPEPNKEKESDDPGDDRPFSMFKGNIRIGEMDIECHVLSDERRVFSQREVVRVLSGGRESGNLGGYLTNNPLYKNQFDLGATIQFRLPGSRDLSS